MKQLLPLPPPLTDSITIDDGQVYDITYDFESSVDPKEANAIDLDYGTIVVSNNTTLNVTTNGGFSIGSTADGNATLRVTDGGVINLTSTAQTNTSVAYDNWYKCNIASSTAEGSDPTATLEAIGENSQIHITFPAFTGTNGDYNSDGSLNPTPNRGAIYFGSEDPRFIGSTATVNLTAKDGGFIWLDDAGKSNIGHFVDSWASQTNITADNGTVTIGGMYSGSGETNLKAINGGQINLGYSYYTQAPSGSTNMTIDGPNSKVTLKSEFAGYTASYTGGKEVININNGGVFEVEGYFYLPDGDKMRADAQINISGAGSRMTVADATYGFMSSGGKTVVNLSNGGSLDTQILTNQNNSYGTGELTLTVSGQDDNGVASTLNAAQAYHYATSVTKVTEGGQVNYGLYNVRGAANIEISKGGVMNISSQYYSASGTSEFKVTEGGQLVITGSHFGGAVNIITVDGANSDNETKATFKQYRVYIDSTTTESSASITLTNGGIMKVDSYFTTYSGSSATIDVSNGGQFDITGTFLSSGQNLFSRYENSGDSIINIDGETSAVTMNGYVNYSGTTTLNLSNGGTANIEQYYNLAGSTTTINIGKANAATPLTLAVAADETAGDVVTQTFKVGSYTNNGTTILNVAENGKADIGSYVNNGESTTIHAAMGSTVHFNDLQLLSGDMNLQGDGQYVLGANEAGETTNTLFYVSGTADAATSTNINFADTENLTFTIDGSTHFTLHFGDEVLAGITEGTAADFELVLVYGNDDFGIYMETADLNTLLANTEYDLGSATDGETTYEIKTDNATYKKEGNNLVWTGTISNAVVPEPATASLSLLGLTGLLLRRRRNG